MCPVSIYQIVVFRCENVILCRVQTSESLVEGIFPGDLINRDKKKTLLKRFDSLQKLGSQSFLEPDAEVLAII